MKKKTLKLKKKTEGAVTNASNVSLSGVSDLDWTNDYSGPYSRNISDLNQTGQTDDNLKQGNDTISESFDQRNPDDSLAFGDQNDSGTTQNSPASELRGDCDQ